MDASRVRYARNGSVRLAYRVFGDGEITLAVVPGWVSNVDLWDDPRTPEVVPVFVEFEVAVPHLSPAAW